MYTRGDRWNVLLETLQDGALECLSWGHSRIYPPLVLGPVLLKLLEEVMHGYKVTQGTDGSRSYLEFTPLPDAPPPGADDAQITAHTMPTSMKAGEVFHPTLTVKNTGTTTWHSDLGYRIGAVGDDSDFTRPPYRFELNGPVAPGQVDIVTLTLTAPDTPGSYPWKWQVLQEAVHWFGQEISGTIEVTA